MRTSRPLRWIEQAEARQILAEAAFERDARRTRRRAWAAAAGIGARLRQFLFSGDPAWRPLLQPEPARASGPAYRRDGGPRDDGGAPYRW